MKRSVHDTTRRRAAMGLALLPAALLCGLASGQTLIWSDEFNTLDTTVWQPMIGDGTEFGIPGWGNNELQFYTSSADNLRIEDGALVIEARRQNVGGRFFTSARLRTINRADFGYGRYEARIRVPATQGIWPAFWMLPTDSPYGPWPLSGEIDIMESINDASRIFGTLHFGNAFPGNQSTGGSISDGRDFSSDFFVYRVDRYPDRMEWYINDVLYSRRHSTQWFTGAAPNDLDAPFDHQRFHFLLNVAVGGNFPGNPTSGSVFPQRMTVDYVRVYELESFQQPFLGEPAAVPGTIQLEDYDFGGEGIAFHETEPDNLGRAYRGAESVDIESTFGGGFHVGFIRPGEWYEYTVDVGGGGGAAAVFSGVARVASAASGGRFRLEVDGVDATGPVVFGGTGGWQTFVNVPFTATLPPGRRVIRLVNLGQGVSEEFNIDTITLTGGPCSQADLSPTPPGSGTFGQLDGNDIGAFVSGFLASSPESDLSDTPPGSGAFGQLDGNDIGAFVQAFIAGCNS